MSNYGLEKYIEDMGINFFRSDVGDRYVKVLMKKKNINLGGEQSGHIILGNFATTGDGLLVALEILYLLRNKYKSSEILNEFIPVPQVLENVVVKDKNILNSIKCKRAIRKCLKLIKNKGRLLVRKSGTENKIRIMVESLDKNLMKKIIKIIKRSIFN